MLSDSLGNSEITEQCIGKEFLCTGKLRILEGSILSEVSKFLAKSIGMDAREPADVVVFANMVCFSSVLHRPNRLCVATESV